MKNDLADDELVSLTNSGQKNCFEILILRYQKSLVNFIFQMIRDRQEAESIAQEAFLKVYVNLRRYRCRNNFKAYLFRIGKNLTLNFIKKNARTAALSDPGIKYSQKNSFSIQETPYADFELKEKDRRLLQALQQLAENQRLALILKIYLQYSYKEIKEVTGWSIPKIETLISRARARLIDLVQLQDKGIPVVIKRRKQ